MVVASVTNDEHNFSKRLGGAIRCERKRQKIKVKDIAGYIKVSCDVYYEIERTGRGCTAWRLEKAARFMNLKAQDLIDRACVF